MKMKISHPFFVLIFLTLYNSSISYEIQEFEHEFEDFPYFRVALSCNLTDLFPQIEYSIQSSTQRLNPEYHECNCTCDFNYDELSELFSGVWNSTLVFSIIPSFGVFATIIWIIYKKCIAPDDDSPSISVQCLNCDTENNTTPTLPNDSDACT